MCGRCLNLSTTCFWGELPISHQFLGPTCHTPSHYGLMGKFNKKLTVETLLRTKCSQHHVNNYVQLLPTREKLCTIVHNTMRTIMYICSQHHANNYVQLFATSCEQLFTTPCEQSCTIVHNTMETIMYNCSQHHANNYVQLFTTPCKQLCTIVHIVTSLFYDCVKLCNINARCRSTLL